MRSILLWLKNYTLGWNILCSLAIGVEKNCALKNHQNLLLSYKNFIGTFSTEFFVVSRFTHTRSYLMCESTINSLKTSTGIVVLFSYEKSQFLLIAPSAHDHSNVAWHHVGKPRAKHITIKVHSQWNFAPTSFSWESESEENCT